MEPDQPENTDVLGEECQESLQDIVHVDSNRLQVNRDIRLPDENPLFGVEQRNFCNGEKQKDEPGNAINVDSSLVAQQRLCLESSKLCKDPEIQSVKGNSVSGPKTETKVTSDVLGIIEEILVRVDEKIQQPSKDKPCQHSNNFQECTDDDDDKFKHGDKRTYSEVIEDDAGIDIPTLEATKDSLYIMSLVETELKAVRQELEENNNIKGKPRLVDYDAASSESSDSSDEESSDAESPSSDDSDDSLIEKRKAIEKMETEEEKIGNEPPKTKDEILLRDLPPEPEVSIVLPEEVKLVHIGSIMSIVESMVVVKSLPNTPALDVDTLLFLEDRKSFGKVFETFGPVQNPFYSVRFNTPEDIAKMNINQGMMVFFAPEDFDCTKLVFVSELKRLKGSDASWKHDQEPPSECLDYSDDEEETKAKAMKKQRKSNKTSSKAQKDDKDNSWETAVSPPTKSPQHKEPSRNWQGRGRGKPHHENNQQQRPCILPQQFPRGPPPPLGGLPPHFMGHPPPPVPPFFPGSLPHGVRPPPYPHVPLPGPPPPLPPPPPGSYHIPPMLQGVPPPWNPGRPPAIFPPSDNRPPPPV